MLYIEFHTYIFEYFLKYYNNKQFMFYHNYMRKKNKSRIQ